MKVGMIITVYFPIYVIGEKKPEKNKASTGSKPVDGLHTYWCNARRSQFWNPVKALTFSGFFFPIA